MTNTVFQSKLPLLLNDNTKKITIYIYVNTHVNTQTDTSTYQHLDTKSKRSQLVKG